MKEFDLDDLSWIKGLVQDAIRERHRELEHLPVRPRRLELQYQLEELLVVLDKIPGYEQKARGS